MPPRWLPKSGGYIGIASEIVREPCCQHNLMTYIYVYIYRWHFKLFILHMCFVLGFVYGAENVSQLDPVCEESNTITQFAPPEIRKNHVEQFGIHSFRSSNRKIPLCLGISLKPVPGIWKELDESINDYEGTSARMPHSGHSDKKRTAEFVVRSRPWLTTIPASQSGS